MQHAEGPVKAALKEVMDYGPKEGYRLIRQECHGKGSFAFFESHCGLVRDVLAKAELEEDYRLATWRLASEEMTRFGVNINAMTNEHIDVVERLCLVDLQHIRVHPPLNPVDDDFKHE